MTTSRRCLARRPRPNQHHRRETLDELAQHLIGETRKISTPSHRIRLSVSGGF
jgi:hypothetical protein